jgi:hypothetical protein
VVDHRQARLVTSVTYDSVSTAGFEESYLVEEVRTSSGGVFRIEVRLDYPLRNATLDLSGDVGLVTCPKARATVDREAKRVRWAVPRACLGNPAWVRVRGAARSTDENTVEFGDDLLSKGDPQRRWSPKLHPG